MILKPKIKFAKPKFKVSDKLVCVGSSSTNNGAGWEEGLVFTVKSIGNTTGANSGMTIYFGAKDGNGVFEYAVKKVEDYIEDWSEAK